MSRGAFKHTMNITIRIKEVYGIERYYPVCSKAQQFARLTGKKTLTDYALESITGLGYAIKNEYGFDMTERFTDIEFYQNA
jgi:hypothetical protein